MITKRVCVDIEEALEEILDKTVFEQQERDEIFEKIINNLKKVKKNEHEQSVGYFYCDAEVDLDDWDVEDYLRGLANYEITDILEDVRYRFPEAEEEYSYDNPYDCELIQIKTLEDNYKYEIVKEIFDNHSWKELEKIKLLSVYYNAFNNFKIN